MSRVKVGIIMACWLALALSGLAQQQAMYQHRLPLEGGGIVWDLGMASIGEPSSADPVWAACDNNGIYRAHWGDYNTGWSDWEEYLPGKWGNGVDVIVLPALSTKVEHVLAATGNWGLFYETSTNGVFCPSVWARPNPEAPYPEDWKFANIRDAAFWCERIEEPTIHEEYPAAPQQEYYVILAGQVGDNYPGLYYWDEDNFVRFDESPQSTSPHVYDHFYRDLVDSNKIWVVQKQTADEYGQLWTITGDYPGDLETITIMPSETGEVLDVYGFSPWYLTHPSQDPENWIYVLVEWYEQEIYEGHYSVFACRQPTDGGYVFEEIYRFPDWLAPDEAQDDLDNEIYRWGPYPYKGVVGKPHFGEPTDPEYHNLWITSEGLGVWYVQTQPEAPGSPYTEVQINNGTGLTPLMRYSPRFFMRDWVHTGLDSTNIILGTHQRGVWYLKFSPAK